MTRYRSNITTCRRSTDVDGRHPVACRKFAAAGAALATLLVMLLMPSHPVRAEDRTVELKLDSSARTLSIDGFTDSADLDDLSKVDLFPNFHGLMPGDERIQLLDVTVSNNTGEVRVYIQAEMPDETAEAMSKLKAAALVEDRTVSGDVDAAGRPTSSYTEVFAPAGEPTRIATFARPGTCRLTLRLFVPYEISNTDVAPLRKTGGEVHWRILVEDDSPGGDAGGNGENGVPNNKNVGGGPGNSDSDPANRSGGNSGNDGTSGDVKPAKVWDATGDGGGLSGASTASGSDSSSSGLLGVLPKTGEEVLGWLGIVATLGGVLAIIGLLMHRQHDQE